MRCLICICNEHKNRCTIVCLEWEFFVVVMLVAIAVCDVICVMFTQKVSERFVVAFVQMFNVVMQQNRYFQKLVQLRIPTQKNKKK